MATRSERRAAHGLPTKRIQITVDVSIPKDWTIGQTEQWLESKLVGHDAEVVEQRLIAEGAPR